MKNILLFSYFIFYMVLSTFAQQATWAKFLNSPVPGLLLDDAQLTEGADGNHFITARDSGSYNGDHFDEYMLLKVNDSGDTLWTTRFGNMTHVNDKVLRASKGTSDSGLVAVFNAYEDTMPPPFNYYMHVYKFDKNGMLQWNSYYRFYTFIIGVGINEDSDHNIIVEGMTAETFGYGVVLFKFDSAGNTLWYRTYYPDFTECFNFASGIYQPLFDYLLLIKLVSIANGVAFFRTDTAGTILSAKVSLAPYSIGGFSSCQLQDGSILVFGTYGSYPSKLFIEKFDGNANFLWGKIYPALNNIANDNVIESADGTLMVTGLMRDTSTVLSYFNFTPYHLKLDASGNVLWERHISLNTFPYYIYFRSGQTADKGSMFVSWYNDSTIMPPSGSLIVKTDSLGNSCLGTSSVTITAVAFSAYDSLITSTEQFYQYDNVAQSPQTDAGCIVVNYCTNTGIINHEFPEHPVNIFPNPATDKITISFPATTEENITIKIFSITGEVVFEEENKSTAPITNYQIPIFNLTNGIYFLSVQMEKDFITKKIIVQH